MYIDKKRGPSHTRQSPLANWLCGYASGSVSSVEASASGSFTEASSV